MSRARMDNAEHKLPFRKWKRQAGRIVIIAPHPDDETLGAGRLILAARRSGIDLAFILLTDGGASHPNSQTWPARRLGHLRKQELRRALGRLGIPHPIIRHMGWRDGHLAKDGKILALRAVLCSLNAQAVFVTSPGDHHPDHKAAFSLALAACSNWKVPLWTYGVWSRVSDTLRRAVVRDRARLYWAIRAHRSQTNDYIKDDPAGFSFTSGLLDNILQTAEKYERVVRFPAARRFYM